MLDDAVMFSAVKYSNAISAIIAMSFAATIAMDNFNIVQPQTIDTLPEEIKNQCQTLQHGYVNCNQYPCIGYTDYGVEPGYNKLPTRALNTDTALSLSEKSALHYYTL